MRSAMLMYAMMYVLLRNLSYYYISYALTKGFSSTAMFQYPTTSRFKFEENNSHTISHTSLKPLPKVPALETRVSVQSHYNPVSLKQDNPQSASTNHHSNTSMLLQVAPYISPRHFFKNSCIMIYSYILASKIYTGSIYYIIPHRSSGSTRRSQAPLCHARHPVHASVRK
ncbi:hypothetical protein CC78DRAFT_92489 [Lojkania enalia]|uniref:Uncharacterized protein n=1 Tax=Lojkania enalia TaxID=147567 RepID=A0A9P4KEL1_9PLEO|nr:hypothetical protein CC78DRAFT_92489 [Didymosphaeria enalia]